MAELSPHSILSHYRVLSKIGAGGMGEVNLAQDTKLDRKVDRAGLAIKMRKWATQGHPYKK